MRTIEQKRASSRAYYQRNREKMLKRAADYRAANPKTEGQKRRQLELTREHYEANKKSYISASKKWRKANPQRAAASNVASTRRSRMRSRGTTVEQAAEQLRRQNGTCAICGEGPILLWLRPSTNMRRIAVVDHDHETGKARGILCNICNLGIGYFHDVPMTLRQAADYLEKY